MGQKVNPISNRLGIIRGWDSNWFGGKNFGDNLVEDMKIRKYLNERLAKASVSRIVIERTLKLVTITICTARPGLVIGKGGQDVDKLKEELKKLYDKEIQINIFEVKKPELDASIVANNIARQVEGKIAYRRAIKMAVANTMRAGAEGIKVQITGRLNGAEMARKEMFKEGRTPLHTFRADIDYCQAEALTKVGLLGIKVWICRGAYLLFIGMVTSTVATCFSKLNVMVASVSAGNNLAIRSIFFSTISFVLSHTSMFFPIML